MGAKLGPNFKVCQNCQYWGGMRDVNGMSRLVEAISEKGRCNNVKGFYNQEMGRMASCQHYNPII